MTKINEVQVYPLKKDHPTIKANGSFILDDAWKVKFAILKGPKGLFVGLPGKKGTEINKETGKLPWYPDVQVIDKEVQKLLNDVVLKAFNEKIGNTDLNQGEAPGPSNQTDDVPF